MQQATLDLAVMLQQARIQRQQASAPNARELARTTDPSTSKSAAARVAEFASHHHTRILAALLEGSGTVYAIAERTGIDAHAVGKRVGELARQGLIETAGEGTSPSGRACRVWQRKARA